jgi:predicted amidophosphoribosyltransferase
LGILTCVLDALLDLVAPPRCVVCGERASPPWCRACEARARPPAGSCGRCVGRHVHDACPLAGGDIRDVVAAYAYTGVVASAVVAAKVGGATAAWSGLGDRLAQVVRPDRPVDLVVAVPTEPRRLRRRGVDHAGVLARRVCRHHGWACRALLVAVAGAPDRGGARGRSLLLPPPEFTARTRLSGQRVLLVDDVLTTGSTALAAARTLARAGAGDVHLAVLARAGA